MNRVNKKSALRKIEIMHALEACLNDGIPYETVTIPQISERAGISKQTFYRYYKNKDEILRWCEHAALDVGINEIGRIYGWHEGIYRTALVKYCHKSLFSSAVPQSLEMEVFEETLRYSKALLIERFEKILGTEVDDELLFQLQIFLASESFASRKWIDEGMTISPVLFADWMYGILPTRLREVLRGLFGEHI